MGLIFHLLPKDEWALQSGDGVYSPPSLKDEGFVHCTGEHALLDEVANRFYRSRSGDFVVLMIDEALVSAPVRWESADGHRFPHIYGPLNRDAIVGVQPMGRTLDGEFLAFQPL